MTIEEAALDIGVSDQYLRRMVKTGKVKAKRHGMMWIVSKASLAKFKREREARIAALSGKVAA